jgi:MYXO-CTERM domain-containing protein
MKLTLLTAIAVSLTAAAAYGQGQINFFTFNAANPSLGKVSDENGVLAVGPTYRAQLFGGIASDPTTFTAIGAPVPFLTGAGAGVIRQAALVTVPGVNPGTPFYYIVKAWRTSDGNEYAEAHGKPIRVEGESNPLAPVRVVLGGTIGTDVFLPPQANGFANFQMVLVPEPSAIALGVLGLGALVLFRRRNS